MGYRSDIYIKATNDIAPDLYLILQQADCLSCADFSEDDNYTYVTMYDLKWYDSYDDVTLVNDFIRSQLNGKATMIRVGEESGDVETYGSDPYDLDLYYHFNIELDGFADSASTSRGIPRLTASHPELFI